MLCRHSGRRTFITTLASKGVGVRVLASLDTNRSAKKGKRTDGDFGLVWIQLFGQGRAFYSAFGHDKEIFWEPTILRHYLAGIQFACGDLAADATPKPQ